MNPNIKVLKKHKELIGKKIIYSSIEPTSERIVLVTEDHCILMARVDYNKKEYTSEVTIMDKEEIVHEVEHNKVLQEDFHKLGVIDQDEYKKRIEERKEKIKEGILQVRRNRELKELERLKKKYE